MQRLTLMSTLTRTITIAARWMTVEEAIGGLGFNLIDVERRYLATYDFRHTTLVVVVGPDGLVANTAKYVGNLPIVAINPDPARIDGQFLPFQVRDARASFRERSIVKSKPRRLRWRGPACPMDRRCWHSMTSLSGEDHTRRLATSSIGKPRAKSNLQAA